ncbi:MAG TPA: hypothetical protein VH325_00410 [Bryobacteraceae bacterium]|jgi:hypothetical protein|nr:hypothetical protein [Bryobacteraceae bacterium]
MNISKEVIKDLLPLYVSGEASDETRELVQHYIETDPELEVMLREMTEAEQMLSRKPFVPDLADSQVRSFQKARLLIRYRGVILGAAIAYSLFPFAFVFANGQMHWIVISEMPKVALSSVIIAVALWCTYVFLSRKARKIGL